jgi:hypothetical protein
VFQNPSNKYHLILNKNNFIIQYYNSIHSLPKGKSMKKGCIILIIIAAIIIIGAGLLWINKDKIINFAVKKGVEVMENAVVSSLPVSVSQDSVRVLFKKTMDKITASEISGEDLRELLTTFQQSMQDKKLDSLEVNTILQGLKKINE